MGKLTNQNLESENDNATYSTSDKMQDIALTNATFKTQINITSTSKRLYFYFFKKLVYDYKCYKMKDYIFNVCTNLGTIFTFL